MNTHDGIIIVIGEILFDVFQDRMELGGAPFNFAFHLKRLGFPVRFISRVGNDDLGKQIVDFLEKHDFNSGDVQIDPLRPTGTVRVTMTGSNHEFKIMENVAWDDPEFNRHVKTLSDRRISLIYFGTLFQRCEGGRRFIKEILDRKSSETTVFCDINLRRSSG